ncbi:MAG: hypothetical protein NE327_12380 [Lentisphaeraceae bacterium]|nr:hypothetical protein [Lentisphaeraceae bacterium]
MFKMLKDKKYSSDGINCIELKKGDEVEDIPQHLSELWLENGSIEEAKEKSAKELKEEMAKEFDELGVKPPAKNKSLEDWESALAEFKVKKED